MTTCIKAGTLSPLAAVLIAMVLSGCDVDAVPNVAGSWSYDWQVRESGAPYDWDGHFHGELVLEQDGVDVVGTIGYPAEDPAVLFGDARGPDAYIWSVYGALVDDGLHLYAPAAEWRFQLAVSDAALIGPGWTGDPPIEAWPFRAGRQ